MLKAKSINKGSKKQNKKSQNEIAVTETKAKLQLQMGQKLENKKVKNLKIKIAGLGIAVIAIITLLNLFFTDQNKIKENQSAEIARSMTYDKVEENDKEIVDESGKKIDYVEFDAFFLRDLNKDGIAEGIRGSSRKVGQNDNLYMEINVLDKGELQDAVIKINNNNFYLKTAIPKDEQIKENAIGTNIKQITFNTIRNGTQKLLTGIISSKIGNNINDYSSENSVTLTGTYVAEDGTKTKISKTVKFNIDWHGTTKADMPSTLGGSPNLKQEKNIQESINEKEGTFTVNHSIGMRETKEELNLKKAYIEGTVPELNGYAPTKVEITGNNITSTYDSETRKFTSLREAIVNEKGEITTQAANGRINKINLKVTYPIEAYEARTEEIIELRTPVTGYYEGFNNTNVEFTNPYKSNIAKNVFIVILKEPEGKVARVDVTTGKHVGTPTSRYIVSKEKPLKIYNELSQEEQNDIYNVTWYAYTGSQGETTGLTMKETKNGQTQVTDKFIKSDATDESMENVTTNIGIYFSNPVNMLGEEGYIKVYDEETNELIETFDKNNWSKYSANNPYKYNAPVKHIRVETSKTKANSSLYIYNVKELNDEYITSNYSKEEFENLKYIKSTVEGYIGDAYIGSDTHNAYYETPYAIAEVNVDKQTISTQETEKNVKITILALANENANQVKWKNGAFLLKMPQDIIDLEINNVQISNNSVKIESYEQYNQEGIKYIKINTSNEVATTYNITVDLNITPDPRMTTKTQNIELYAFNENAVDYWNKVEDTDDVNGNLNKTEKVQKSSVYMSFVSPNSLLTNQTATNYDEKESIVIAPQIAEVTKEQRTADINIEIKNNYTNTISELKILGRVPFKQNTYTINKEQLGSNFTVTMKETGIVVPTELENVVKVYYSENGQATKEMEEINNWKAKEEVTNWSEIKSYLIDLGTYSLARGENHKFTYTAVLPEGLNYNQISYSHHGVYFSLDTEEGKYRTRTEPNKLGLMIAKKYDLELTKYQKGKENKVQGATYRIVEKGQEEGKTKVTDENGKYNIPINVDTIKEGYPILCA